MPLSPGDPVRIAMEKWGGLPHWRHDATFLGSDEHGDWVGLRTGTTMARPGLTLDAENDMVMLVPARPAAPGGDLERAFVATFYRGHAVGHTYVDMATPPVWDGDVMRSVDLDLDVIRVQAGFVWVDDEDEFEEHQVELHYPAEIIELAVASSERILDAVLAERPPFDGATAERWFATLDHT